MIPANRLGFDDLQPLSDAIKGPLFAVQIFSYHAIPFPYHIDEESIKTLQSASDYLSGEITSVRCTPNYQINASEVQSQCELVINTTRTLLEVNTKHKLSSPQPDIAELLSPILEYALRLQGLCLAMINSEDVAEVPLESKVDEPMIFSIDKARNSMQTKN